MKDWIKKALTKRIRQREIPPDPRLVYGVKFTIAMKCLNEHKEIRGGKHGNRHITRSPSK